jgi:hypothetical protein
VSLHEVVGGFAGDTGLVKNIDQIQGFLPGGSGPFSHHNQSMIHMPDEAGAYTVQANETKASQDLVRVDALSEYLFISESVLEGQHDGVCTDQRGKESRKQVVRGCFQSDDHQVAWADL